MSLGDGAMTERYAIVIIGSGPAGISAAARAAMLDCEAGASSPTYLLLESYPLPAQTIQHYQKGKYVMAEPEYLDLRSSMPFCAGSRESVLDRWVADIKHKNINLRTDAEVAAINGSKGDFNIVLKDGESIRAGNVILAIGVNGNPNTLGVEGDETSDFLQYTLSDPQAFSGETIVVVGAGDSGIENALALSEQNDLIIVNRGKEFSRAKGGNLRAVLRAINDNKLRFECLYGSSVKRLQKPSRGGGLGTIVLNTVEGEKEIACHRIIARLGAIPPRKFVQSCGIKFPSDKEEAFPELSRHYESNVPGLYIIGSLAGFPLIKQAMNQGYEVVEYIRGNDIKPADHPLIQQQFALLPIEKDVDGMLAYFQQHIPLYRQLNTLTFREVIIESHIVAAFAGGAAYREVVGRLAKLARQQNTGNRSPRSTTTTGELRVTRIIRQGGYIFQQGDHGDTFFTVVRGDVHLIDESTKQREAADKIFALDKLENIVASLGAGDCFGEMSLLSGRPRTISAIAGKDCILLETPRRMVIKLMNSYDSLRESIELIFHIRSLRRYFGARGSNEELRSIAQATGRHTFEAGQIIYQMNSHGDHMHLLRSGTVTLTRELMDRSVMIGQSRSGQSIGEMAVMGNSIRQETATAAVRVETISIKRPEFEALVSHKPKQKQTIQEQTSIKLIDSTGVEALPKSGDIMSFLMAEGLGEATNVLIIDEDLCIGCNNCEKACAETHAGISRLNRKSGASFHALHVPTACRHCEIPHCMKDCPPNAIHSNNAGEIYIDNTCIGCGNCESNCPYDAIELVYAAPPKPGLWQWLLFGLGPGPGEEVDYTASEEDKVMGLKAVKCDACTTLSTGPACVNSCPTGAAARLGPEDFNRLAISKS